MGHLSTKWFHPTCFFKCLSVQKTARKVKCKACSQEISVGANKIGVFNKKDFIGSHVGCVAGEAFSTQAVEAAALAVPPETMGGWELLTKQEKELISKACKGENISALIAESLSSLPSDFSAAATSSASPSASVSPQSKKRKAVSSSSEAENTDVATSPVSKKRMGVSTPLKATYGQQGSGTGAEAMLPIPPPPPSPPAIEEKAISWLPLSSSSASSSSSSSSSSLSSPVTIVTFNVNGLRAAINKGFVEYVNATKPDAIALSEIKGMESDFNLTLPGYSMFYNSSTDKKGYAGTAVFVRKASPLGAPIKVTNDFEEAASLNGEGRVITVEFDTFYLVNTYVPNAGQALERLVWRTQTWDPYMLRYINGLEKKGKCVIWTGDLNVAHREIDIHSPSTNLKSAGFTVEERANFDKVVGAGWVDSFRFLHKEDPGYTYWGYRSNARETNKGWRLDYFVVSPALLKHIDSVTVGSEVNGQGERMSDHAPLTLKMRV